MDSKTKYTTAPFTLNTQQLGSVTGLVLSKKSKPVGQYFGGIPYALPPLGSFRFRRPRPLPLHYKYGTKANPGNFTGGCAVCPQPAWGNSRNEENWNEDCLHLNIYIPAGTAPKNGWPVFFYIHGGFLQWGNPNMSPESIAHLLDDSALRCIIVQPAYRLNVFGFIASADLHNEAARDGHAAGNMGFWDQRLALEWTHSSIRAFGGDPSNITVGGYSAGSHSTFQQLAHELYFVPDDKAVIKRVIMWSNGPGVQAKGIVEQQKQFDELLAVLGVPLSLTGEEKLKRLRETPAKVLIDAQKDMSITEFRATTDDSFISRKTIAHINSGDFVRRMKKRGMKLMNGECRDEHNLYRQWRTAHNSFEGVHARLCADYPEVAVSKLLEDYCGPSRTLPSGMKDWQDFFGHAYANLQVHCLERGFHRALVDHGLQPGKDLLRYRIEWRADCCGYPPEWGVTHATDMAIWFWYPGLTKEDKRILKPWNEALAAFVRGDDVEWGTEGVKEARRLRNDGRTDVWTDNRWEEGLHIWQLLNGEPAVLKSRL
ncbi:hypothetical protein PG985_006219 [Apiospora marii]|uniref:Carboxylic ester hydrolase n=1 Tax=Apiospora marii TaxID=335849 RepID=A0ABR1S6Z5_9PEZI